jgi:hypothetical protein
MSTRKTYVMPLALIDADSSRSPYVNYYPPEHARFSFSPEPIETPMPSTLVIEALNLQFELPGDLFEEELGLRQMRRVAFWGLSDKLAEAGRLSCAPVDVEKWKDPRRFVWIFHFRVTTLPVVYDVTAPRKDNPYWGKVSHVSVAPDLEDGLVVTEDDGLIVGTEPMSWAKRAALETVRRGLADVLAWLGESAEVPTGKQVVSALRKGEGVGTATIRYALKHGTSDRSAVPFRPYGRLRAMPRRPGPFDWILS